MTERYPRELLVLRHGKSSWDSDARTDYERPLADRGLRDAPRMGAWMLEHDLAPDLVVSSPAQRARETAELALEALERDADEVLVFDERIYGATATELLYVLAERAPETGRVMLVGHNPGFEDLVVGLAASPPPVTSNGKVMPTCALAHLGVRPPWEALGPGEADLLALLRPKAL